MEPNNLPTAHEARRLSNESIKAILSDTMRTVTDSIMNTIAKGERYDTVKIPYIIEADIKEWLKKLDYNVKNGGMDNIHRLQEIEIRW